MMNDAEDDKSRVLRALRESGSDPIDGAVFQRVVRLAPNEYLRIESAECPDVCYSLYMCLDGKSLLVSNCYKVVDAQAPVQPVREGCLLLASNSAELHRIAVELASPYPSPHSSSFPSHPRASSNSPGVALVPRDKLVLSCSLNLSSVANTGGWAFETLQHLDAGDRSTLVQAGRWADYKFWASCVPLIKAEPESCEVVATDWDPSVECVQYAEQWLNFQGVSSEGIAVWRAAACVAKSKYFTALGNLWRHGVRHKAMLPSTV
ncbi:protein ORF120 [Cyprinid herpesvirus 3]|uniref:ORF120R n=1 Tax=Cyprinid herpesvirus 3 TaxID=180230 RepID=A3QMT8_CYHV3|nr:unnamed protein product [Cyprinid herpesvirus 3]ABC55125.1 hypothetical protein [Cyprinid herpesvirus 3]ABG42947.1 protein ORF120 [Cyprinid herpesvirus 3]AIC32475.1 ORF120R [Cyprinid herpesvirus 3]AJP55608.1 protein ORF120 [Cyprinid herpesvirus 3]AJP55763.1 protein ORF120 [Cyprinid herpesvirus 3]